MYAGLYRNSQHLESKSKRMRKLIRKVLFAKEVRGKRSDKIMGGRVQLVKKERKRLMWKSRTDKLPKLYTQSPDSILSA